jgi:hypothetical protein
MLLRRAFRAHRSYRHRPLVATATTLVLEVMILAWFPLHVPLTPDTNESQWSSLLVILSSVPMK